MDLYKTKKYQKKLRRVLLRQISWIIYPEFPGIRIQCGSHHRFVSLEWSIQTKICEADWRLATKKVFHQTTVSQLPIGEVSIKQKILWTL